MKSPKKRVGLSQALFTTNPMVKTELFHTMIVSGPVIIREYDGRLQTLLVKHGDKPMAELKWKFCGGKVISGQGLEETALREATEEIGIKPRLIKPLKPVILWQEIPETGTDRPEAILLIHFLAEINQEPIAGPQILAMEWFDLENLPLDCAPNVHLIIEDYLQQK